jgi:hypothetical protein
MFEEVIARVGPQRHKYINVVIMLTKLASGRRGIGTGPWAEAEISRISADSRPTPSVLFNSHYSLRPGREPLNDEIQNAPSYIAPSIISLYDVVLN